MFGMLFEKRVLFNNNDSASAHVWHVANAAVVQEHS